VSPRPSLAAGLLLLLPLAGCGLLSEPAPELGDCLQRESIEMAEVDSVPTVSCEEEHDAQVVAVFDVREGDYPDDAEWEQLLVEGCLEGFEAFVGVPYEESALELQDLTPTPDGWEAGDREVLCVAYLPDGSTTQESFEGSGV
jgi:hypothetical protein